MDYLKFNEVYNKNKELDERFTSLYGIDDEIIRKNKLELLVELGELANESKCFKYWTKKEPNRDMVLEEYADCLLMVFRMFNDLDVSLDEKFPKEKEFDLIDQFMYLFDISSKLKDRYDNEIVKEIFVNVLNLGYLLDFSINDIIYGCMNKIEITFERLS